MRLFVAIDISDETRAQVKRVRQALQRLLSGVRNPPRVTWVADEAAHVTLRFIGEVPETIALQLRDVLSAPFDIPAFDLEFKSAGTFPGSRSPRVVWIGISSGLEPLAALADAVNGRVDPIVAQSEERPFRGHLTVGRVKDPGQGFDWPRALHTIRPGITRTHIAGVTLYQSRTSPKGPTYTGLAVAALAGAARRSSSSTRYG